MFVATHKCGCPVPSSIAEPVELGAPCSPCCPRPPSTHYPKIQPTVSTRESQKIIGERRPKSRGIRVSNARATASDRIVSEIVRKGQPYKEIEAVINDNRVIVRMHKEPIRQEYDPPCECIGQRADEESTLSLKKCDDGIAFDMAEGSLELHRVPRGVTSSTEKIHEEPGCRTVTLYPQVDAKSGEVPAARSDRADRSREKRLDLEENPNIFVLRIRKYSDNSDKKQKIDLEFRAPRPWREDKELRKDLEKPEELEKHGELEADELEENEMLEKYELDTYNEEDEEESIWDNTM